MPRNQENEPPEVFVDVKLDTSANPHVTVSPPTRNVEAGKRLIQFRRDPDSEPFKMGYICTEGPRFFWRNVHVQTTGPQLLNVTNFNPLRAGEPPVEVPYTLFVVQDGKIYSTARTSLGDDDEKPVIRNDPPGGLGDD